MLSDYTPATTLAVSDLERARAFYEGVLGFTPEEDAGGGIFYRAGAGRLFVYPSGFAGTNQATSVSFEIPAERFDAEVRALRDADIGFDTFEMEGLVWADGVAVMDDMRSAWFKDPDGNIINIETRAP